VLDGKVDLAEVTDDGLSAAVAEALAPPPSEEERRERLRNWDPVDLLVPEWPRCPAATVPPASANASTPGRPGRTALRPPAC
jgi:hypothetical protein